MKVHELMSVLGPDCRGFCFNRDGERFVDANWYVDNNEISFSHESESLFNMSITEFYDRFDNLDVVELNTPLEGSDSIDLILEIPTDFHEIVGYL